MDVFKNVGTREERQQKSETTTTTTTRENKLLHNYVQLNGNHMKQPIGHIVFSLSHSVFHLRHICVNVNVVEW